jgi:TetR/AcrR family transcriptional regulator
MGKSGAEQTRRGREEGARRAHILGAAERLFAERGLAEASVADIAKEAEFGVGTLYKYFEDKSTLIRSLVEDRLGAHFTAVDAALASEGAPEEVVGRFVEAYLDSIKRRAAFFKFFMTNFHPGMSQEGGPVDMACVGERRDRIVGLLRDVLQRGIDAGRFAPLGADELSAGLFGMVMAFNFYGEIQRHGEWTVPEFKETILKIFFQPVLLTDLPARRRRAPARRGR